MKIKLRTAKEKDLSFLLDLRRQALQDYVIETWGRWDEARQHKSLLDRLNSPMIRIIQYDDIDIGMLSVEERLDEFFLENIVLFPAYHNRGIGTRLVNNILQMAQEKGLPVRLQVLRVNPARSLYERLGFSVTQETPTHYVMSSDT